MSGSRRPTFGVHNPSPIKKRNVKKTTSFVVPSLLEARRAELFSKLQQLYHENLNNLESDDADPDPGSLHDGTEDVPESPMDVDETNDNNHDGFHFMPNENAPAKPGSPDAVTGHAAQKSASILLYQRWRDLLPSLVDPLLEYISTSLGKVATAPQELRGLCQSPETCTVKSSSVFCLFVDRASTSLQYYPYVSTDLHSQMFRHTMLLHANVIQSPRCLLGVDYSQQLRFNRAWQYRSSCLNCITLSLSDRVMQSMHYQLRS